MIAAGVTDGFTVPARARELAARLSALFERDVEIRISSITARYRPSFGTGRPSGERFGGGIADSNACRTARRCTPCRLASSRIDSPSRA